MSERRSILCPNCNKLISRDEEACPYCGTAKPGTWLKNNALVRGLFQEEGLVSLLITLNVGVYLLSVALDPGYLLKSMQGSFMGWLSPSSENVLLLGGTGRCALDAFTQCLQSLGTENAGGAYGTMRGWTLLSAMYLHGGILHIAFNMYALRQLMPMVLQEYGTHRTISIYTLGGIGGFWLSYMGRTALTVGASGAVCALIGAMLFYGYRRGGTYGQEMLRQVGGWIIGLILIGVMMPRIDNFGHGGGLVAGALLGFALQYKERQPDRLYHRMLSAFCILLTVGALGWGIVSTLLFRLQPGG